MNYCKNCGSFYSATEKECPFCKSSNNGVSNGENNNSETNNGTTNKFINLNDSNEINNSNKFISNVNVNNDTNNTNMNSMFANNINTNNANENKENNNDVSKETDNVSKKELLHDNSIEEEIAKLSDTSPEDRKEKLVVIIISVVMILLIAGLVVYFFWGGNKEEESEEEPKVVVTEENENDEKVEEKDNPINKRDDTDTQKEKEYNNYVYEGFTFKIPVKYVVSLYEEHLYLTDQKVTWSSAIRVRNNNYNSLKKDFSILTKSYQASGFKTNKPVLKKYSKTEMIVMEIVNPDGDKGLMTFSYAGDNKVFVISVFNINNKYDYDSLTEIAKILESAGYIS